MDDFPSPLQPHRTVQLSEYDPAWPLMYAEREGRLKEALGSNLLEIHHVGSTAIPGMSGKARIDILGIIQDRSITVPFIQSLGFQHQGEQFVPGRKGFSSVGPHSV